MRPLSSVVCPPSFAGLVVSAGSLYPIPSRTRPLNSPAPMVLSLKAWKSRSLPGLPRTELLFTIISCNSRRRHPAAAFACAAPALRPAELWNSGTLVAVQLWYASGDDLMIRLVLASVQALRLASMQETVR
jgi:hypothetical protein